MKLRRRGSLEMWVCMHGSLNVVFRLLWTWGDDDGEVIDDDDDDRGGNLSFE